VKDTIDSSRAAEPVDRYAHARRVGNLLFLSGVGPRVRGSKEIPGVELGPNGEILSHDIEAQCHSAFRNVRIIIEDFGIRLETHCRYHRVSDTHEGGL